MVIDNVVKCAFFFFFFLMRQFFLLGYTIDILCLVYSNFSAKKCGPKSENKLLRYNPNLNF